MKTIKTKNTDGLMKKYLQEINASEINSLSLSDKENLFRKIVAEYKVGNISIDELSPLSETIWWSLSDKEKQNSNFGNVLMSGMELSYYERGADNEKIASIFLGFLREVLEYGKEYKNI